MARALSDSFLERYGGLSPRQLEIELAKTRAELAKVLMEAKAAELRLRVLRLESELEKVRQPGEVACAVHLPASIATDADRTADLEILARHLESTIKKLRSRFGTSKESESFQPIGRHADSARVPDFVSPESEPSEWTTPKSSGVAGALVHQGAFPGDPFDVPGEVVSRDTLPADSDIAGDAGDGMTTLEEPGFQSADEPLDRDGESGGVGFSLSIDPGQPLVVGSPGDTSPQTCAVAPVQQADSRNLLAHIQRFVGEMPSWLVSVIAHVIVLLAMALWMLPLPLHPEEIFISSGTETNQTEEFEEVVFEAEQLEVAELEEQSSEFQNVGAANLAELSSVTAPSEMSEVGVVAVNSAVTEIVAVFGDEGSGMGPSGAGTGGAEFFGVKAGGNRFAFIVDCSRSMRGGRWDACRNELVSSVRSLGPQKSFYVIFYGSELFPMFDQKNPEKRLLRAAPETVTRFEQWVRSVELVPGRSPNKALEMAIELRPDVIFLLTDGKFPASTEAYLKRANQSSYDLVLGETRPAVIHTIGFGKEGEVILRRIAEDNGGTFRLVVPLEPPRRRPRN